MASSDPKKASPTTKRNVSPETDAWLISRLMFAWLNPLVSLAMAKPLVHDDLYAVRRSEEAQVSFDIFKLHMEKTKKENGEVDVKRALISTFWRVSVVTAVIKFINTLSQIVPFIAMRFFLTWMASPDSPIWIGYLWITVIFLCMTTKAITENLYFHRSLMTAQQLRACLITAICQKSLRLSLHARQSFTTGELTNLLQLWTTRIEQFVGQNMHQLNDGLFQILAYLAVAIWVAGPSAILGVLVIFPLTILQQRMMAKIARTRRECSKFTDDRIRMVTEIFSGIRAIKSYSWEVPWGSEVNQKRLNELAKLQSCNTATAVMRSLMMTTPLMMMVVVFFFFSIVFGQDMDAARVFTTLAVFNNLRMAMMFYPMALVGYFDVQQGALRLNTFLNALEVDSALKDATCPPGSIKIRNATFAYKQEGKQQSRLGFDEKKQTGKKAKQGGCCSRSARKTASSATEANDPEATTSSTERIEVLRDVSCEVESGELLAIVGPVGSGKSSLVSSILGELVAIKGDVLRGGKVAFAPQVPWIMNATLKDNILFYRDFDADLYGWVLEACCMTRDLELLPSGDLTEIGERGINLSGGQKQRVSLARTMYSQADIYIFDDPLSALDAEVGRSVFENCLLSPRVQHATRILITHASHTLSRCQKVLTLELAEDGAGIVKSLCKPDVLPESSPEVQTKSSPVDEKEAEIKKPKAEKDVLMTTETKQDGAGKRSAYWNYLKAARSWTLVLAMFVFQIFSSYLSNAASFWLSAWGQHSLDAVGFNQGYYLLVFIGITIVVFACAFIGSVLVLLLGNRASTNLHDELLKKMLTAPLSFFDTTPLGRILNRFSADFEQLDNQIPQQVSMFFMVILSLFGIFGSIAISVPWFAVGIPPIFVVYYFIMLRFRAANREIKRCDSIALSPIYSHYQQILGGIPTIRAYNLVELLCDEMSARVDFHGSPKYCMMALNRWLSIRLELLGSSVLLITGYLTVNMRGTVSSGNAGVALTYAVASTSILNFAVRTFGELEGVMNCVDRILEYIQDVPCEAAYQLPVPSGWPANGELKFEELSVRYRPQLPLVLKSVSFAVAEKWRVGIVGRTGSGKSTLILAMLRLVEPASGYVRFAGENTSLLGLETLRQKIAIVPQEPVLWTGTLRKNLDPFNRCNDTTIWESLAMVGQRESLEQRFPKSSLNEIPVTEYGDNFSQGQRQLFCIVRAILQQAPIVLMDEATSALDETTDALVQKSLRHFFTDSTLLIIAHRLRTIADCDRILVLENGETAEFDTPKMLLSDPQGKFSHLVAELGNEEKEEVMHRAGVNKESGFRSL